MTDQAPPTLSFGQQALERFGKRAPLAMALRLTLEHTFAAEALDAIFERCRTDGYTRTMAFSMLVDVMGAVVTGRAASPHAAMQKLGSRLTTSITAAYNKLQRVEPNVSAGLVHHVAARAREVIRAANGACAPLLPTRRVRILDGNHLAATERRLEVLWGCAAGPRPGFCIVALDPALRLFTDVIPCEDAHTQERALTAQILGWVAADDCWIADRNFCTRPILFGIDAAAGTFVVRQHGNLEGTLVGERRACGRTERGALFEQTSELTHEGRTLRLRRVTIELDGATRDGDRAIHLLTSLAESEADAAKVAELYLARWTIETAFAELARWLDAELKPLGYPRAALFAFCVGLTAYNVLATVLGALRAVHGETVVAEEISGYHIHEQTRGEVVGIDALLEESDWLPLRAMTTLQVAAELVRLVGLVDRRYIRKARRGPKKPVPKRTRFKQKPHVSTQRLLDGTVSDDS